MLRRKINVLSMSNKWFQRRASHWRETEIKYSSPGFQYQTFNSFRAGLFNSHQRHRLLIPRVAQLLLVTNAIWVTAQTPWQGRAAPINLQRWKHLRHLINKQAASSWWAPSARCWNLVEPALSSPESLARMEMCVIIQTCPWVCGAAGCLCRIQWSVCCLAQIVYKRLLDVFEQVPTRCSLCNAVG